MPGAIDFAELLSTDVVVLSNYCIILF